MKRANNKDFIFLKCHFRTEPLMAKPHSLVELSEGYVTWGTDVF